MPSFIADGYEFGSGFNPIPSVHDGIEVFHRPMTPVDSATYQFEHDQARGDGAKVRDVQAKWLLKKIVRWQSRQVDGKREQIPRLSKELLTVGDGKCVIDQTLLAQMIEVVIWGAAPDYRIGPEKEQTDADAVGNS